MKEGQPSLPGIHLAGLFLYRILFCLHERRATSPRRVLAIH